MTSTENNIGSLLQAVGVLVAVFYTFRAFFVMNLMGGAAFEIFLQGVVYGTLLIGFGEIIKLMQGLFNQREPEPNRIEGTAGGFRILQETDKRAVSPQTESRIKEFYAKKNMAYDTVEATPYEGFVVVHRQGRRDLVDLNGFQPEILSEREIAAHPDLSGL